MLSQVLGDPAAILAQLTRALAHCCVAKETEIFSRFGLSASEGNVLLAVAEGASSPSVLAEYLGVVRSRITPLVQGLVDKEFLQRNESVTDRRVRELRLTRRGEQLAADAVRYRLDFHRKLLDKFDYEERERLFEALERLHDKMTEMRRGIREQNLE